MLKVGDKISNGVYINYVALCRRKYDVSVQVDRTRRPRLFIPTKIEQEKK
jgi:hypothetical protein